MHAGAQALGRVCAGARDAERTGRKLEEKGKRPHCLGQRGRPTSPEGQPEKRTVWQQGRCGSKVGEGGEGTRAAEGARQPAARPRLQPHPHQAICGPRQLPGLRPPLPGPAFSCDGALGSISAPKLGWPWPCSGGPPGARSSVSEEAGRCVTALFTAGRRGGVSVSLWPLPRTRVPSWHCTVMRSRKHRHAHGPLRMTTGREALTDALHWDSLLGVTGPTLPPTWLLPLCPGQLSTPCSPCGHAFLELACTPRRSH